LQALCRQFDSVPLHFIFIIVLASAILYGCKENPKKENVYRDAKAEYLENENTKLRKENTSLKKEIL
jgi:uncharacterized protein YlxW (UPF0749 family)